MKTIIETLFEVLFILIKGIFDLICFVLQINPNDRLYEHSQMKSSDKRKLFSRFNKGLVVNGKKRITIKQALTHTLVVGKSGIGENLFLFSSKFIESKKSKFCNHRFRWSDVQS